MRSDAGSSRSDSGPPSSAKARQLRLVLAILAGVLVGAGAMGAVWALTGDRDGTTSEASPSSTEPHSASSSVATAFVLTGTFELTEGAVSDGNGGCKGGGGYDDIAEGAAVTVYDAGGAVVATGFLGESSQSGAACRFDVAVEDVPAGKGFYKVEISHRGTIQLAEAEAHAGAFSATLG